MTGDQNLNKQTYEEDDYFESDTRDKPKLLTDIERVVNGVHKSDEIDDTVEKLEVLLYGNDDGFDWANSSSRNKPKSDGFDWTDNQSEKQSVFSFDNDGKKSCWSNLPSHPTKNETAYSLESARDADDSDVSEWTRDIDANESNGSQWDSKDWDDSKQLTEKNRDRAASFHEVHSSMHDYDRQESLELVEARQSPRAEHTNPKLNRRASASTSSYKYQICLFIQMQLCRPTTLSDWIKQRNVSCAHFDSEEKKKRAHPAFMIFRQIVNGLEHVHDKGIIHRDLKPAVSVLLFEKQLYHTHIANLYLS